MAARQDGSPNVEDTRTLHAGLPPKAGVKYGLNCFFNEPADEEAAQHGQRVVLRALGALSW
eukprot:528084-Karenia_brevis.AAC.1